MESWHPFAVHVPIALVLLWPWLDLAGLWLRRPDLSLAGLILLSASVPATLFATVTGQAAYDAAIAEGVAPGLLAPHVDRGELVPWLMVALLVFRLIGPRRWGRAAHAAALALGVAAALLVVAVGQSGGSLVFESGVGVRLYREKGPR